MSYFVKYFLSLTIDSRNEIFGVKFVSPTRREVSKFSLLKTTSAELFESIVSP